MPWAEAALPEAVREAVASGWLNTGDRVLDIGCGDGTIAAFLAEAGCVVTAIDFAEGAVARTRERCRGYGERVHAELCDVTSGMPSDAHFDAVIDVGCFQSLVPRLAARYGRNVATACRPGARMLLVLPLAVPWRAAPQPGYRKELETNLARALTPAFTVTDMRETRISMVGARGVRGGSALVAKLVRP